MDGARDLGGGGRMSLHHFHDEEAVFVQQAGIDNLAFEIGVALLDQRSIDLRGLYRSQLEFLELIDLSA